MYVYRVFTTVLKALGTNFSPSRSNVSPADVKKVRAIFFNFMFFISFFKFCPFKSLPIVYRLFVVLLSIL